MATTEKKINDNSQSRKWLLTINNPADHGFTHDKIIEIIDTIKLDYFCMCDETGKEGTYHTHLFLYCFSPKKFSLIKKLFPPAHIDKAYGSCQENYDYVRKEGKWEKTNKKETNHAETFYESGELPEEKQGKRNDLLTLQEMLDKDYTDAEIIDSLPQYMFKLDQIETAREVIRQEKYKDVFRDLDTTYIYGKSALGKTRSVMEEYGYSNVYRVTDYSHPFDNYQGQEVILFDEFRSSLKICDMLCYLDGYPLQLPCRYRNKQACYVKVYIISNISIDEQYTQIQKSERETWLAFLRRIHHFRTFKADGSILEYNGYADYKHNSWDNAPDDIIEQFKNC